MHWIALLLAFDTFAFLFEAGAKYVQLQYGIATPMPDEGLVGLNAMLGLSHLWALVYVTVYVTREIREKVSGR